VTRCSQSRSGGGAPQADRPSRPAEAGRACPLPSTAVSTRRLIVAALLCGVAILVAFAVQVVQLR
jgi:hypothetical protein